jgi:hypothetical protein
MFQNHRRGGALAGIILMTLIVGFVCLAALVSTGLYVAENVRVTARDFGGETKVETPFGNLRVRDHDRSEPRHMGLPIYPGAVREHGSHNLASLNLDFGGAHKSLAFTAAYRTSDSIQQVTDYYKNELPHWLISQSHNGCLQLSFTKGGYKRFVALSERDGETRIALASVGEPASN